ncbi:hypothetical protein [Pedobacter ureilyticus]|uniref:Uncharacterized protein n=1 Tax=Pedobacter ureilyticus TaxID=1393051 RepID=A0ABW9J1X4_9SPHI|nr:hypothetical protein [Pedobacter helvus]
MPRKPKTDDREPLERLKDLIGFKWSYVITALIGLYVPVFGIGYFFGGINARSEAKETTSANNNTSTEEITSVVRGYERIVGEYIKEQKRMRDSIDNLENTVHLYQRISNSKNNGRKTKK